MKEVDELLRVAHQFMEVQKTDSAAIIVSPETFAKIQPALRDIEHDKMYSKGKLGPHTVKSDLLVTGDTVISVCKPIEYEDMLRLRAEDYLPAFTDPEVEKLRKHIDNAKKEELRKQVDNDKKE